MNRPWTLKEYAANWFSAGCCACGHIQLRGLAPSARTGHKIDCMCHSWALYDFQQDFRARRDNSWRPWPAEGRDL